MEGLRIQVHSRNSAARILADPAQRSYFQAVVSIEDAHCAGDPPLDGFEEVPKRLRLHFGDWPLRLIERSPEVLHGLDELFPTPKLAQQIIDFGSGLDEHDQVLVHCMAGISRSTAAALILARVRNGSHSEPTNAGALMVAQAANGRVWSPNDALCRYADEILGSQILRHRRG